jgi:hypothetical protein
MTANLLFWIYIVNAVILIIHEIDSAYWQEWKLINPKEENGINGFLILHFPMIFAVLYGLVLIEKGDLAGLIISLFVGASGIFAFFFHFHYLKKGRPEFNTVISKTIIISTFLISLFQIILTIKLMIK